MLKFKFKIIKLILNTELTNTSSLSSILGPIGINPNLFYQEYIKYISFKKKILLPVSIIVFNDKSFVIKFNMISTSFFFLNKFKELWKKKENKKYLLNKFISLKQIQLFPITKRKISKIINSTLNSYYNILK